MVCIRMYDLQKVGQHQSYNIAEYVIGWRFDGQHDGEKIAELCQTVSCSPPNNEANRILDLESEGQGRRGFP